MYVVLTWNYIYLFLCHSCFFLKRRTCAVIHIAVLIGKSCEDNSLIWLETGLFIKTVIYLETKETGQDLTKPTVAYIPYI